MRPPRVVLGLVAIALFSTAVIAKYNFVALPTSRVGPGWFQVFSMFGGTATMLVGAVALVAFAQSGRSGRVGPPGLRLGVRTLRIGAFLLVAGVLWLVLLILSLVPSPVFVFLASLEVAPVFIAIGAVLLRNSVVALRREAADPLTTLTLGKATFRTGLVLLLLGFVLLRGLGFHGAIFGMQYIPAGLALIILGRFIGVAERSTTREQESTTSCQDGPARVSESPKDISTQNA